MVARLVRWFAGAGIAEQHQFTAALIEAVIELTCWSGALFTGADGLGLVAKFLVHPLIKDIERTLPEPFIAKGLAIANDAALDLIDLFKSAVNHDR